MFNDALIIIYITYNVIYFYQVSYDTAYINCAEVVKMLKMHKNEKHVKNNAGNITEAQCRCLWPAVIAYH